MLEFMDYIQGAFFKATKWSHDNSYADLSSNADALLDFPIPQNAFRLSLSSLASPQFALAYQLGAVDGSISYLYSSVPVKAFAIPQSDQIPLSDLCRSYRPLSELPTPEDAAKREWSGSRTANLLYGKLNLPSSVLEALYVRRVNPSWQVSVKAVSSQTMKNGGTMLAEVTRDVGKHCFEALASSDGGMIGFRGLYNLGVGSGLESPISGKNNYENRGSVEHGAEKERIPGRVSIGGEAYAGMNASGGMSLGLRYQRLPTSNASPLTFTMALNPLIGQIRWDYAIMAGQLALASRMSFNVYSYDSDFIVGMELWQKQPSIVPPSSEESGLQNGQATAPTKRRERSFQAKLEWRLDDETEQDSKPTRPVIGDDEYSGVLKARLSQHKIDLLWESRYKSILFSLATGLNLSNFEARIFGIQLQFSS